MFQNLVQEKQNDMMPDDPPPSSSSDNNLLGAEGQVQFNVPAEKSFNFRALPRVKKFIVITFSMVNFCVGVLYSALGPFFPSEVILHLRIAFWHFTFI